MYVVVSGVFVWHHCCLNFKVMELLSSAAAVWLVRGELLPRRGLRLRVGAVLSLSFFMWIWCTKLGVKNRWWTPRSFLGDLPKLPVKASKTVMVIPSVRWGVLYLIMLCYCVHIHIFFWVPSFENVHVSWISYVEFEVWLCYSSGYYVEWVEVNA